MRKSRPNPPILAKLAEALITGSETIVGVNLNGCVGNATQNRKEQRMKQGKGLNPMSANYIHKLNNEVGDRIKLCLRCKGTPVTQTREIHLNNGKALYLTTVTCVGGMCEICGEPAKGEILRPHEYKLSRGQGGRVSLENSVMSHWRCHLPRHTKPKSELQPLIPKRWWGV